MLPANNDSLVPVRLFAVDGGGRVARRKAGCLLVREDAVGGSHGGRFTYENEGGERIARGSVSVAAGVWWSADLVLADGGDSTLWLRMERHGQATSENGSGAAADLFLPAGEIDAIVALIAGVVAQGRGSGMLPESRAS